MGSDDAPALAQRLAFSATVNGTRHDLVQTQAYLSLPDIDNPAHRAVIRLALTATEAQHHDVLGEFQDLIRTVHSETGGAKIAMGFLSKWTGTKVPDGRVTPKAAAEVRGALLALNNADVPYSVREGEQGEKADLVAECHIKQVGVRLKTSMRLVPEKHEVRVLHERWENRSADYANEQYGRGHAPAVFTQRETVTGPTAVNNGSSRSVLTPGR
ncbi:hypothetical protein [Streptomyces sp. NPDC050264]|uniref:hypothetical protein n=1 Tax=Streptomyces sp. NPDC050264 TaxID=3155038 RepID=UPI0034217CE9